MTRIIFQVPAGCQPAKIGTYGSTIHYSTLIWDDTLSASSLVSAINTGAYGFPMIVEPGPVYAIQHGDMVIVTRPLTSERIEVHLKPREQQVLIMLAEGRSLQQIAYQLSIAPRTVTSYVARLKEHLGAGTREQLVARAVALGLYRPSISNPLKKVN